VVGSNLMNQMLILAAAAFLSGSRGLTVDPTMIQRDLPIHGGHHPGLPADLLDRRSDHPPRGGDLARLYGLFLLEQSCALCAAELSAPLQWFTLLVVSRQLFCSWWSSRPATGAPEKRLRA